MAHAIARTHQERRAAPPRKYKSTAELKAALISAMTGG